MIHWYDSLPSTMDTAHQLAKDGAPHGDAVAARKQLAGRGRRGHPWYASEGGLWLSVICRLPSAGGLPAPSATECLSVRVGLALTVVLEHHVPGIRLALKWPNDVLLRGRKLAGILCEGRWAGSTLSWVVVGVGVNITNALPDALAAGAIGLAGATGSPPDVDKLAPEVTAAIAAAGMVNGPLTQGEVAAFDARDALRGRRLAEPVSGTAAGISDSGALVVIDDSGVPKPIVGGGVIVAS